MSASRSTSLFDSQTNNLPAEGIGIFTSNIPLHLVKEPQQVEFEVFLSNRHIEQTGVARQPDERFALQIELNKEGARLLTRRLNLQQDLLLYLSIDAQVVSVEGLDRIAENQIELGGLTFEAVYSLAEHLGYDQEALSILNNLRPRGDSQTRFTGSQSIWKLTPNGSDVSAEILDDIFDILNNRVNLVFEDQVRVERAQASLRLKSFISVDYDRLLRLVTTLGHNTVFALNRKPAVAAAMPADAVVVFNEEHILGAEMDEETVRIELNADGIQKLSDMNNQDLYLAIDNKVISEDALQINDPVHLSLVALSAEEAAFVAAIIDNDTLPASLSFVPLTIGRSDQIGLSSYGELLSVTLPDDLDLSQQDLDEIQELIQNRFNTLFGDTTSIENEGGVLTIVPDSNAALEDITALVTGCGESEFFLAPFPPRVGQPMPAGVSAILTQDHITGASYQETDGEGLLQVNLSTEGLSILKDEIHPGSSLKLWLALDGKVIVDRPFDIISAATLRMLDVSAHDGRLIAAFLDNDLLPFTLELQNISTDAYNTFTPEDNQVWYIEANNETGFIHQQDMQSCLDILNQRAAELMPGQVSFESDDSWGIVIQFLNEGAPIDLDLLEQVVAQGEDLPVPLRINMEEV